MTRPLIVRPLPFAVELDEFLSSSGKASPTSEPSQRRLACRPSSLPIFCHWFQFLKGEGPEMQSDVSTEVYMLWLILAFCFSDGSSSRGDV